MQFCSHISRPIIRSLTYPATKTPIACWPWISHEGRRAPIKRTQGSTEQLIHASCRNCLHFVSCVCLPVYIFLLGINYSWVCLFVSSGDSRGWSRCKYEGNNRSHWLTSLRMVWKLERRREGRFRDETLHKKKGGGVAQPRQKKHTRQTERGQSLYASHGNLNSNTKIPPVLPLRLRFLILPDFWLELSKSAATSCR